MDKNAIKRYAVWARRELIDRVATKAKEFGITEEEIVPASADSIKGHLLTKAQKAQRTALIEQINKNGYKQVIEGVAYTWFNRFSALRFMEVNGYLPTHIRVFTDEENNFKPQILAEAIHLELDGLQIDKVYELKQENKTEELFKYLIITQCNALGAILPGMFQKIEDYTELLFPDNLLREDSVVQQMIEMIPEEDWTEQVQIIGWLYQYYNTEPKDKVFADLKRNIKISKENIPAATQLFTPDWIVRYMVENSLGRLWIEGHPNAALRLNWHSFIDEAEQESNVKAQLEIIRSEYSSIKPEEIKVIDPCMGSGHILAYMFDVLVQMYEAYGYSTRDAVQSIIKNNLFGLDIDDRAAQLAYFSVMMKARQYDKRFFSRKNMNGTLEVCQPCVYSIVESNNLNQFEIDSFINGDKDVDIAFSTLIREMHDAKEYGSILNISPINFDILYDRVNEIIDGVYMNQRYVEEVILPLIQVGHALSTKYDIVITNPPYMGSSGMSSKLSDFTKKEYPTAKLDLFACFIDKCERMTKPNGFYAMITQQAFLFLGSYEKLRYSILNQNTIINMLHFGYGTFGADFGTTAFVIGKRKISKYEAQYVRLADYRNVDDKQMIFESVLKGKHEELLFYSNQERYFDIPGMNFVYWISERFLNILMSAPQLQDIATIRVGMHTGNNDIFVREWYELPFNTIGFNCSSNEETFNRHEKWYPYNKGGGNRRWYGYRTKVVNWQHGGADIHRFHSLPMDYHGAPVRAKELQFKEGITWSDTGSTGIFASRYSPLGAMFDVKGSSAFMDAKYLYYVIGFLNVKIATHILNMFNPTITYQVGNISTLPLLYDETNAEKITSLVEENISLAKHDYDIDDTSWDFEQHPLVRYSHKSRTRLNGGSWHGYIKDAFFWWENECNTRFARMKSNEEELNRIFINIYGLQDEVSPEVVDDDISIRKADLGKDIRSFVSYAVGCMFGRYSLDEDGLILAGEDFGTKFTYATVPLTGTGITGSPSSFTYAQGDCYLKKKDGSLQKCSFAPDKDNILPICDDEYFEDDIVGKFVRFVATVYGEETLDENLRFIAEALGGKGAPREVIRNYFLNDFYNDHLKIYQKRPIYWQFDSGKKNGFKCLIYMHRYQPDTIARIRTDYVHEQQARYRTAIAGVEQRIANASTAERVKLNKQLIKLKDQETEIHAFEEKIHHLADQMIRIDLDDGVKHNYEIFKDVLTKIK